MRKYPDMWVDPEDDPREVGVQRGGERETLVEFLRFQRLTFAMKCSDLDAAGLAKRSVPPSIMSLLGLIRHLADVERSWFRRVMAGEDAPPHYRTTTDRDAAFTGAVADSAVVSDAWERWRAEVANAEQFVISAPDLGVAGRTDDITLRELLTHMIEEYARHNGHADLIRERVDGRTGQ